MNAASQSNHSRQLQWIALASLLLALSSGCAANYAFPPDGTLDVSSLVAELETKEEDEKALFDVTYIPFAHMSVTAFSETEDALRYPRGHSFFSMKAWLPFFGIVDADVERFDTSQSKYERDDITSILWGLWYRHENMVKTNYGDRIEKRFGLLWIFDVGPDVRYGTSSDGPS